MRGLLQPTADEIAELTAADEARHGGSADTEGAAGDVAEPEKPPSAKKARKGKGAAKAAAVEASEEAAAEDEAQEEDAAAQEAGDEEDGDG